MRGRDDALAAGKGQNTAGKKGKKGNTVADVGIMVISTTTR
jgi:hypothetical protein